MMENEEMLICGFIGEQEVGKTSFINKFFRNNQIGPYNPTIAVEFSYACFQLQEGSIIRVKCWDTSGENKYKNMVCYHLKGVDVIAIFFDLTSPTSFSKVNEWVERLKKENVYPKILYLVGNKTDILKLDPSLRKVSKKQGEQKAKQIFAEYVQISVKTDDSFPFLSQAFQQVISTRAEKLIELQKLKTNLDLVDLSKGEKNSVDNPCQCIIF